MPPERRSAARRQNDMEAMAKLALSEIRNHVEICEQQNIVVLKRMDEQDTVLNLIREVVLFVQSAVLAVKRSVKFITWAGGALGGIAAIIKFYVLMHP